MAIRSTLVACFTLAACLVPEGASAAAQEPPFQARTPNTLTAPPEVRPPRASLQDMAWFAGHWSGTGLGAVTDETWSTPAAGAMMGMFRLVKDGKVVFYEFLTLVEHEGSILLKLKHFNPDLTGWEEKGDFVTLRLLKITPAEAFFNGLTFRRVGADRLEIFLAIRNRADGTLREERFEMVRTPASH